MEHLALRFVRATDKQIEQLSQISEFSEVSQTWQAAKATLVEPLLVSIFCGVESATIHLAGFISPGRLRLTSKVLAYNRCKSLVLTRNSVYRVTKPLSEEEPSQDMWNTIAMIVLGQGSPAAKCPPGLH